MPGLAHDAERRWSSSSVISALADVMVMRGVPEHLRSDNKLEFVAKDLRNWLAKTGAKTLYIEPGSPWENGYCESFNSKLRDEFLNGEIFYSMKELRVLAERWRVHYNTIRPHSSLGYRFPAPEAWLTNNMGQPLGRCGPRSVLLLSATHRSLFSPRAGPQLSECDCLSAKIGNYSSTFSLLHIGDIERGQLTSAECTAYKQREHGKISLAFERAAIRYTQQILRLFPGQPVAHPVAALGHIRDIRKIAGLLCTDELIAPSFGTSRRAVASFTFTVDAARASMDAFHSCRSARVNGRPDAKPERSSRALA